MDDHFETLGLTRNSSEAEIRQRCLELVRAFSPERAQSGSRRSTPPTPPFATPPADSSRRYSTSAAAATRSIHS